MYISTNINSTFLSTLPSFFPATISLSSTSPICTFNNTSTNNVHVYRKAHKSIKHLSLFHSSHLTFPLTLVSIHCILFSRTISCRLPLTILCTPQLLSQVRVQLTSHIHKVPKIIHILTFSFSTSGTFSPLHLSSASAPFLSPPCIPIKTNIK